MNEWKINADKPYITMNEPMTFEQLKEALELEIPEGQVYTDKNAQPPIAKTVLRYSDSKGDKFWQCERLGSQLMVNYGKWGTNGRYDVKEFDTEEACIKQAEKLINAKKKAGYKATPDFEEVGHLYFDCENSGISPLTGNPVFRKYCGSEFYYDCGNEYAPFGNDTGNDANFFMQDWMRSTPIARSGEYAYLLLNSRWKMPCIPPLPSRAVTDRELLEIAESDFEGFSGAEIMRLSDQTTIAAVLAKFRIKGSIERYEIFQLFRSLDRMERLCRLLNDKPPAELLIIIRTIRSDIYCYDRDRYANQYYSLAFDFDEFWMKKVRTYEAMGRSAFGIPEALQGRALAEKVYETVEELRKVTEIPEDFKEPWQFYYSLGCLFGQAVCHEYGWTWMECGEPTFSKNGFGTMTQFNCIVSPDKLFSIVPSYIMRTILDNSDVEAGYESDNTMLLLFNMIAKPDELKRQLNPNSIKYMTIM